MLLRFAWVLCVLVVASLQARADLIGWYRSDQVSTVSGRVTQWTDLATGDGQQDATDGGMTYRRPLYSTSGFGIFDRPYVEFVGTNFLLTAAALFSGNNPRTIAAVYRIDASGLNKSCFVAGEVNAANNTSFFLQSRGVAGNTGSPYLTGWNSDMSSLVPPVADRITFAVASYDGTTARLSWAFEAGDDASTNATKSYNTSSQPFRIGSDFNTLDRALYGDIAEIRVYNTALSAGEQTALIENLQGYYTTPEPASWALFSAGLAMVAWKTRRRV